MKCPVCNSLIQESSFCPLCGAPLSETAKKIETSKINNIRLETLLKICNLTSDEQTLIKIKTLVDSLKSELDKN